MIRFLTIDGELLCKLTFITQRAQKNLKSQRNKKYLRLTTTWTQ